MNRCAAATLGVLMSATVASPRAFAQTTPRTVFSYDSAGNLTAVADSALVPETPTNLSAQAEPRSGSRINLAWTDAPPNVTGFTIVRRGGASGGIYVVVATVATNVTQFADDGLEPSTTYVYRVKALGQTADSEYSNEAGATTGEAGPNAPSNLTATATYASQIDLWWSDNSSDEVRFSIERRTAAAGAWVALASATTAAYSDTAIAPSTSYVYRVRAIGVLSDSASTNEANATTAQGPESNGAVGPERGRVRNVPDLAWTNNAPTAGGFKVERKDGATGTYVEIATVPKAPSGSFITTYTDVAVQPGTLYTYRVRAYGTATGIRRTRSR